MGGGHNARPGEVSLAHRGVLFLDELPEFSARVLEVLREPLEAGAITISRASHHVQYPARFQLAAAMNPCPCGFHGDPGSNCRCTTDRIRRYHEKISGPLLDRIDLLVEVPRLSHQELTSRPESSNEGSAEAMRSEVGVCRQRQYNRASKTNSELSNSEIERFCRLSSANEKLLETAIDRLRLSARGYHRLLKIARTIADVADHEEIQAGDLLEAVSYRRGTGVGNR